MPGTAQSCSRPLPSGYGFCSHTGQSSPSCGIAIAIALELDRKSGTERTRDGGRSREASHAMAAVYERAPGIDSACAAGRRRWGSNQELFRVWKPRARVTWTCPYSLPGRIGRAGGRRRACDSRSACLPCGRCVRACSWLLAAGCSASARHLLCIWGAVQSLCSFRLVPRATTASTYSGRTYGCRIPADILQLADRTHRGRPC
jgi:hypothetical protein